MSLSASPHMGGTLPHSSSGGVLSAANPHPSNCMTLSSSASTAHAGGINVLSGGATGVATTLHQQAAAMSSASTPHVGVAAMSSVTKAVQLTATVNSVPVTGPSKSIIYSS